MKTASVGKIQKNFSQVLREIGAGEEIVVTKRGKPVAMIFAMGADVFFTFDDRQSKLAVRAGLKVI